jgi:predicted DNA-binding protein with PD1-like motif
VSWTVHPSAASRHLLLRASAGEILPGALVERLSAEAVACGWLRASGVLTDVELQAFDSEVGGLGRPRRIAGLVHVLSLESGIALSGGEPSFSMRAVLARETDRGLETVTGEIVSARTVALEVFVTALDDVALGRALDPAAGVWLVGDAGPQGPARAPSAPAWSGALSASERAEPEPYRPKPQPPTSSPSLPGGGGAAMPQRPARPPIDFDSPSPETGDLVDHFAFGPAEVVKSDGDRLHLRVPGSGRVREIALEMLRVTRLEDTPEGKRHFRLERRI